MGKSPTKNKSFPIRMKRLDMTCRVCNRIVRGIGYDTVSVTCRWCVISNTEADVSKNKTSGFPRGWHLKAKFVSEDGRVFHKGIEQTETRND
jgi:hypothetical protein